MLKRLFLMVLFLSEIGFSQADLNKAQQLFTQKKYAEAKVVYEQLLKRNPSDLQLIEKLGDVCSHSKSWNEAAAYYGKLKTLDPKNAQAHYKYGGALAMDAASGGKIRAIGMLSDIRKSFETAIFLNQRHVEARWALVEYYLEVPGIFGGSQQKANQYADELSGISKVDHYLAKGRIEEYFGRLAKAEKFYLKAHEIGNSETTLKKLSSVYAKMNRPDKAKAVSDTYKSKQNASTKT